MIVVAALLACAAAGFANEKLGRSTEAQAIPMAPAKQQLDVPGTAVTPNTQVASLCPLFYMGHLIYYWCRNSAEFPPS
jgi:hypothetical protein